MTLVILGFVAALAIVPLLHSTQEQEYKTGYKKAYSMLSEAFLRASQQGDIVPLTGSYSSQGNEADFAAIKKQFSVVKECTGSNTSECWASGETWRTEYANTLAFVDNSGMAWKIRTSEANTNFPAIFVDTNGAKKPNQYGKDRFAFTYSDNYHKKTIANDTQVVLTIFYFGVNGTLINDMGMPARIVPFGDVTVSSADNLSICPSLATLPSYNQTCLGQ